MPLKRLPALLLFALAISAHAQNSGFTNDLNNWFIEEVYGHPDAKTWYTMRTNGDTTLQGMVYRKMYKDQTLLGAVREDSAGTVYFVDFQGQFYGNGPNQELELYKFGAQAGDSTVFWRSSDSLRIRYLIVQIDSLEVFGKMRKLVSTICDYPGFAGFGWVEGLGTLQTPLQPLMELAEFAWTLLCFNGIKESGAPCTSQSNEASETQLLQVWPNPATHQLTFSGMPYSANDIRQVKLLDAQGKLMLTSDATQTKLPLTLDVEHLNSGVYFAELHWNTGHISRAKVFICH